jgi:hypothetical protein
MMTHRTRLSSRCAYLGPAYVTRITGSLDHGFFFGGIALAL